MTEAAVRRDIAYAASETGPLTMDVYRPADAGDSPLPAIILAGGFPDAGVSLTLGCTSKQMEMVISWAQLIAATGICAVAYTKQNPSRDLVRLVHYLRADGTKLGIVGDRVGLWAASGNVPVALSLLMRGSAATVACAALLYGFMLDAPGHTAVADAAAAWKFANPAAGKSVADLRPGVPLLVVRAGADQFAGLNDTIDRFVVSALAHDVPLTLVNHAGAPHAFDLMDASEASRRVIRQVLAFLREHLRVS
jgi:dienelactone hydrolase